MKIILDLFITHDLKKGKVSALEKIFKLYNKRLYYFINSYTRDKNVSEELVGDVFIKLWNNREKINTSLSINNYLYTIAKNLAIDYISRKKLKIFYIDNINEIEIAHSNEGEQNIVYSETEKIINEALNRLADRKKEIFLLHRIDKLTYKQISSQVGISISAVEKNISSALKSIQKFLEKNN